MARLKFALIDSENLELEDLHVDQVYIVVDLPDEVDPTTAEMIRDDEAVQRVFNTAKNRLNTLCEKWFRALNLNKSRLSTVPKKRRVELEKIKRQNASSLRGEIRKDMQNFDWELKKAVTSACKKQLQTKQAFEAGKIRWRVAAVFSTLGFVVKAVKAYFGDVMSAIAALAQIMDALDSFEKACMSEAEVREQLTTLFQQIESSQNQEPSSWMIIRAWNSLWGGINLENAKRSLTLYQEKIEALDQEARTLSTKLDTLLDNLESKGSSQASEELQSLVEKIVEQNQVVALGKTFAARSTKLISEAERKNQYTGQSGVQTLVDLATSWNTFLLINYAMSTDKGLELILDEVKKSGKDQLTKGFEDFVGDNLKKLKIAKVKAVHINANDIYEMAKIAVDPPKDKLSTAKLAAGLLKQALEKHEEVIPEFKDPLFQAVRDHLKDFTEEVSDALEGDDDEGESENLRVLTQQSRLPPRTTPNQIV